MMMLTGLLCGCHDRAVDPVATLQAAFTADKVDVFQGDQVAFQSHVSIGTISIHLINLVEGGDEQPADHYAAGLSSFYGHRAFIQEAVDSADNAVDFSDLILIQLQTT